MKKISTLSSLFGQVSLVVALLATFVFSSGNGLRQFMMADSQPQSQQLMEQEQDQDDERPNAYLEYACNALVPVAAQLNFLHQPHFEAPLPPVINSPEKPHTLPIIQGDRYFRTLFTLIISPNAP